MKPVLILQFMANDAPAYLGTWLQLRGITCDVRLATTDVGFPERIDGYSALALLGGSMSANDDLPFLRTAESHDRSGHAERRPGTGPLFGWTADGALARRSSRRITGTRSGLAPHAAHRHRIERRSGSVKR